MLPMPDGENPSNPLIKSGRSPPCRAPTFPPHLSITLRFGDPSSCFQSSGSETRSRTTHVRRVDFILPYVPTSHLR